MKNPIAQAAFGNINQHGYIVADAEKAAKHYADMVGAGPFYVGDFNLDDYRYRGLAQHCRVRIAIGYWGPIQLEFVQPLEGENSLYAEALPQADGLLNHFSIPVADLEGWLAERKLTNRILQSGEARQMGIKFVYLDKLFPGGIHLEVIQAPIEILTMFAKMAKARLSWDGRHPIRPFAAVPDDLAAIVVE